MEVAHCYRCPITLECFVDPVSVFDGDTFERVAITRWLTEHDTNPVTGVQLETKHLAPNISLRHALENHLETSGCSYARFREAVDAGNVALSAKTLIISSFLNRADPRHGATALAAAAVRKDAAMVTWLLSAGATVSAPTRLCDDESGDSDGEMGTALHQAAISGCTKSAAALLAAGADVLATTAKGLTPLHVCTSGDVAALLYERDPTTISARTYDEDKATPLHCAAFRACFGVIEALLSRGACADVTDASGESATVYLAASASRPAQRVACLRALLKAAKDTDIHARRTSTGESVLAAHLFDTPEPSTELIRAIVALGTDITTRDKRGYTLVHFAALNAHGALAPLRALRATGILGDARLDVNARSTDATADTALELLMCSAAVTQDALEVLLACGADPELLDADGHSALSRALAAETQAAREPLVCAIAAVNKRLRAENAAQQVQLKALHARIATL